MPGETVAERALKQSRGTSNDKESFRFWQLNHKCLTHSHLVAKISQLKNLHITRKVLTLFSFSVEFLKTNLHFRIKCIWYNSSVHIAQCASICNTPILIQWKT
jgi:hypothetical protein